MLHGDLTQHTSCLPCQGNESHTSLQARCYADKPKLQLLPALYRVSDTFRPSTIRPRCAFVQYWKTQHDKKLLYGVMTIGHGAWQNIYLDKVLDLEHTLRQELGLPPPLMTQVPQLPTHLPPQLQPQFRTQAQISTPHQALHQDQSRPPMSTQALLQPPLPSQAKLQPQSTSQGQSQPQVSKTSLPSKTPAPSTASTSNTAPESAVKVEPETDKTGAEASKGGLIAGQPQAAAGAGVVAAATMSSVAIASGPLVAGAIKGNAEMVGVTPTDASRAAANPTAPETLVEGLIKVNAEGVSVAPTTAQGSASALQAQQAGHASHLQATAADQSQASPPAATHQTAARSDTAGSSIAPALQSQQQHAAPLTDLTASHPEQVKDSLTSGSWQPAVEVSLLLQTSGHVLVKLQVRPDDVTGTAAHGSPVAAGAGQTAAPLPTALSAAPLSTAPAAPSMTVPAPAAGTTPAPASSLAAAASVAVPLLVQPTAGTSAPLVPGPAVASSPAAARVPAVVQTAAVLPQLGCSKCRWARTGCRQCQERLRQLLSPSDAAKVLAEGAFADRMTDWLSKRVTALCHALKQKLTAPTSRGPAQQQQPRTQKAQRAQQAQHAQQAGRNMAQLGQSKPFPAVPIGAVCQTGPAAPIIHQVTAPVTIVQARPSAATNASATGVTPSLIPPGASLVPVPQPSGQPILQLQSQQGTAQPARITPLQSASLPQQAQQPWHVKQQQRQITQFKQQQRLMQQQQEKLRLQQQVRQQHAAKMQLQAQQRMAAQAQQQTHGRQIAARPQSSQAPSVAANLQPTHQQQLLQAALHGQAFAQGKSSPVTSGVSAAMLPCWILHQKTLASDLCLDTRLSLMSHLVISSGSLGWGPESANGPQVSLTWHKQIPSVLALHLKSALTTSSTAGNAGQLHRGGSLPSSQAEGQSSMGSALQQHAAQPASNPHGSLQYHRFLKQSHAHSQQQSQAQQANMWAMLHTQPGTSASLPALGHLTAPSFPHSAAPHSVALGVPVSLLQGHVSQTSHPGLAQSQAMEQAFQQSLQQAAAGVLMRHQSLPTASGMQSAGASPRAPLASQQMAGVLHRGPPGSSPGPDGSPQLVSNASVMTGAGLQQSQAVQRGMAGISTPQQEAQTRASAQALAHDNQVAEAIRSNLKNMKPNLQAIHAEMLPNLPSDANVSAEVSIFCLWHAQPFWLTSCQSG